MDNQFNPRMLVCAREYLGLTQKQLSDQVNGLSQGNLSRIEKGLLPISSGVLASVAAILKQPLDFFWQEIPKISISRFYYRKRVSIPQKALSQLEAQIEVLRLAMENLLGGIDIEDFVIEGFPITDGRTPEQAARKMRDLFKLPHGPINNLVNLIEDLGAFVYFLDSSVDKFDGITVFMNDGRPLFILNKNMPGDRIRFTLAHELGHLIMHLLPTNAEEDEDTVEYQANSFASEFLMPELDCRGDLVKLTFRRLNDLKSFWKVSKAFILRRAKNLNMITPEKYKYLQIELSRQGERKVETGFVPVEYPSLINEIINLYRTELQYSLDDLAKITRLLPSQFEALFSKRRVLRIA